MAPAGPAHLSLPSMPPFPPSLHPSFPFSILPFFPPPPLPPSPSTPSSSLPPTLRSPPSIPPFPIPASPSTLSLYFPTLPLFPSFFLLSVLLLPPICPQSLSWWLLLIPGAGVAASPAPAPLCLLPSLHPQPVCTPHLENSAPSAGWAALPGTRLLWELGKGKQAPATSVKSTAKDTADSGEGWRAASQCAGERQLGRAGTTAGREPGLKQRGTRADAVGSGNPRQAG